jgi:hypothetical protein
MSKSHFALSDVHFVGRAGRKGTHWENGVVTARDPKEIKQLRDALNLPIENIRHSAAGLLPTFEQVRIHNSDCHVSQRLWDCQHAPVVLIHKRSPFSLCTKWLTLCRWRRTP